MNPPPKIQQNLSKEQKIFESKASKMNKINKPKLSREETPKMQTLDPSVNTNSIARTAQYNAKKNTQI
jgi:hypothetical protein